MPERTLVCQPRRRETKIEIWRVGYNTVRPHSSMNGETPEHFARITKGLAG
jgi:transposase InsO family protein